MQKENLIFLIFTNEKNYLFNVPGKFFRRSDRYITNSPATQLPGISIPDSYRNNVTRVRPISAGFEITLMPAFSKDSIFSRAVP